MATAKTSVKVIFPLKGGSVAHFLSLDITTLFSETTNTADLYTCQPTHTLLSLMTLTLTLLRKRGGICAADAMQRCLELLMFVLARPH